MKNYEDLMKEKFEKLKAQKDVLILSIESSCDETAIAIVKNGREVLANVVSSQIEIHRRFGGVVPEVASRNHILAISNLFEEAISIANIKPQELDAIAVTFGAGLMGALLVGVNFAKGLAYSLKVPLIAVSHIHGHIAANYISHQELQPPFVCLMVSGGHTAVLQIDDYTKISLVGTTVDDAVGEAFDKVARVLSLPYPGGPEIDRLAKNGKNNIKFTVSNSLKDSENFSFSGIKTAVINYLHNKEQKEETICKEDVARSFEEVVTDELVRKTFRQVEKSGINKLVIAGGVGANSMLQEKFKREGERLGVEVYYPLLKYCTDNAAMIGSAAYYYVKNGKGLAPLSLSAKPTVNIGD